MRLLCQRPFCRCYRPGLLCHVFGKIFCRAAGIGHGIFQGRFHFCLLLNLGDGFGFYSGILIYLLCHFFCSLFSAGNLRGEILGMPGKLFEPVVGILFSGKIFGGCKILLDVSDLVFFC